VGRSLLTALLLLACPLLTSCGSRSPKPPPAINGVVGWQVYRRLDELPELPVGVHEYEVSSYDRTGGNNDGFLGTYSCQSVGRQGCVIAQHSGPGEIDSIWFTRDGGNVAATGNIRIELDGRTVLDAPLQAVVDGRLGVPFVYPLVANSAQSSGGVYIKVPMPFHSWMRITTASNPRFYHVFFRTLGTARGVDTFNPSDRAGDVIAKLRLAGHADPKPPPVGAGVTRTSFRLTPGETARLSQVRGPGEIVALRIRIAPPSLARVRLQIAFDGRPTVDAPLGEFFGSGLGDAAVHALMFAVDHGSLVSWWPMPYRSDARIRLVNASARPVAGRLTVMSVRSSRWAGALSSGRAGYFAASSHAGLTSAGADWPFLEIRGTGKLVGVAQTMTGPDRTYLEGDDIGYIDGSSSPQLHGTGTEDFYEGGWYWNRGPFSDPFNGEPSHQQGTSACPAVCDSAYRLMLADSVPFTSSINYGIEHGSQNTVGALYSSTAFWYERIAR
jgi:D-arabinan exo alpha-(1,3)/(1,5)-arabinofuranosidase (non-reducing end)